jgi:hypothetical protein
MVYRRSSWILTAFLIIGCITMLSGYAAAAYYTDDTRYSGMNLVSLIVDTAELNNKALANFDILGQGILLVDANSFSGSRQGWAVGGFVSSGKMTAQEGKAELSLNITGVSIEKSFPQGLFTLITGAKAGVGKAYLHFLLGSDVQSWEDARQGGRENIVSSSFWFIEPYAGARMQITDFLALEAKLGLGMSMSDGQWKQRNTKVGYANYSVGGFSVIIGVTAGIY